MQPPDVTGKNLQIRINAMSRSGMISKSDAERLHAIGFMGNDAAHEIKKAKKQSVLIALKIIEHILLSVYVFEDEVNQYLEKPISTLDDALPILTSSLKKIGDNSTFTYQMAWCITKKGTGKNRRHRNRIESQN
ncbi:DUF4145 domain-containing protein [Pseudomonas paeninsulae]|uniref:DUF4145 domain-containing protein n=1 Tax=Pseudomonas paeninsulae TaxID=3110772 RepID=UPI002D79D45C|nr:DUF4145 domain-containing protein [Pseudomonas sp. IT1137]